MKFLWVAVVVSAVSMVGAIVNETGPLLNINCTKPFEIISRQVENLASFIRCRFYIPRQEICPRNQILSLRAKRCVYPSRLVQRCNPYNKFHSPMPRSALGRNPSW